MTKPRRRKNEAVPAFLKRLGVSESEWLYAAKSDLKYFQRPGHPLRVRVAACIIAQSSGYRRDVCVLQTRGDSKKDGPKLRPLWPAAIELILRRAAIEAYEESGIELDKEQRERLAIDKGNMHAALRELEEDDGFIVRVAARCDPARLIQESIPLEEALKRNLITPIAELTKEERGKLHGRTLIYKRAKCKPATAKALKRLDEMTGQGVKFHSFTVPPEERQALRILFKFLTKAGLPKDPALTMNLAHRNDVRAELEAYSQRVKQAEEFFTGYLATLAPEAAPPAAPEAAPPPAAPAAVISMRPAGKQNGELAEIAAAAGIDRRAAGQMLRHVRAVAADATVDEIKEAIARKIRTAARKENPTGFLITAVANLFDGPTREQLRAAAAPTGPQQPDQTGRLRQLLVEEAYAEYRRAEIDRHLDQLPADRRQQLNHKAEKQIRKEWPHLPDKTIAEMARARIHSEIAGDVELMSFEDFEATDAGRLAGLAATA